MTDTTAELQGINNRPATAGVASILGVCVVASAFLLWLVYLHHPPAALEDSFRFLPALNAVLNGLSAIALTVGFFYIRSRQVVRHRNSMMLAFLFSSMFLVSYILNHWLHGDTLYPVHNTTRIVYLIILASHIVLSMIALPFVLITFFLSLSGRFPQHKRVARWTFPLWLYVSVTGVVVYLMLHAALGASY